MGRQTLKPLARRGCGFRCDHSAATWNWIKVGNGACRNSAVSIDRRRQQILLCCWQPAVGFQFSRRLPTVQPGDGHRAYLNPRHGLHSAAPGVTVFFLVTSQQVLQNGCLVAALRSGPLSTALGLVISMGWGDQRIKTGYSARVSLAWVRLSLLFCLSAAFPD